MHFLSAKSASLGIFDREFRGKEQQEKPRVREFRELWIASLRGLSVVLIDVELEVSYQKCRNT